MQELSRSEKDYMEAIYVLKRRLGSVRSVDGANYLEHSKPSITRAVSVLSEKGYLKKVNNELIFTELGRQIAEQVIERHCILTHALKELGIDEVAAVKDAQNMERVISDQVVSLTATAIQCQKRLTGNCPRDLPIGALVYG
ncbi:metal-dependent transcriptional regulator [Paenibacillus sp. HN-1]|uniref:metal-dependent transcriptional regulator n=1 Tax=Paenibacillus TaxID=44249 RepID=UPI001CA97B86|nr:MULTISPECIES: metal-dependent transcriptional regulator [Paenibacillus]MBY9079513.1 metal-dependent transcriptional regulator [Paenibacillus sp. CGMCC 1.18879]MBY9086470.1 metal-dependent transcriptional regulator [Paenibacillus sinensis]